VNCGVSELPLALLVVASCVYKCAVNPTAHPNAVYGHTHTRVNTFIVKSFVNEMDEWMRHATNIRKP
jgi:hypothetical protein